MSSNTYFPQDGLAGVNLDVTSTDQKFALGQRCNGNNNTVWVYGKAAIAVTKYDFVTIDASGNINPLMGANVALGQEIGAAQVAFAASDYGWVCVNGLGVAGAVVGLAQPSTPVVCSTSTGKIATTAGASGQTQINGIGLVGTGSAGAAAGSTVNLTFPTVALKTTGI